MKRTGSLLVMTLWVVVILSALAVAIARYLSLEVRLTSLRLAREQARVLARSGVYLAMQRLAHDAAAPEADGKTYDWAGDDWAVVPSQDPAADPGLWAVAFPLHGAAEARLRGRVDVRIADESGRLDLNTAAAAPLLRLSGDAALAQAILDARDEPDAAEDHPELAPPYVAKNGPFAEPEELADLPGMSPEASAALRAHASPYRLATEPVNLNTASPEALAALGLSDRAVQLITQFRDGPDGAEAHEQDGVFTVAGVAVLETLKHAHGVDLAGTEDGTLLSSNAFGVASALFRVRAEGVVERPAARVVVEAVVRRSGCGDGAPSPCLVAWRES
jgi:general secretion pathway protein K